jgi:uncharacterized alpha-E superfamily protein
MAMLSRVADSLFWMGRYLERAEQMARQLEVTRDILLDLAEPDPEGAKAEWHATIASLCVPNVPMDRLVFDPRNVTTLAGCIGQARENARQVREVIANEMWERLNQAHWNVIETRDLNQDQDETAVGQILTDVLTTAATWDGLTDSCMHRGEAWIFLKLGKWIERLERIARIAIARHRQGALSQNATQENVISVVTLKSVGALEAYRKLSPTKVERRVVLEFLLFQPDFPRSLRFCALQAAELTHRLSQFCRDADAAVGRAFGRLASRLDHSDLDEVIDGGVEPFLNDVLGDNGRASSLLQRSYFLH